MRLHWLLPTIHGIPVLMYHRVWPGRQDGLTLTPEQLRDQWMYLRSDGWQCLPMADFLEIAAGRRPAPRKAFVLTFDDGYRNNLTYVYPLLRELGWSATIFIIADTLDGTSAPVAEEIDAKLSADELRGMDPAVISLGMHGYHHENFSQCSAAQIAAVMQQSERAFAAAGIPCLPVLAYPYGARPKEAGTLQDMKAQLAAGGLTAAFRIGNKPQQMPAADLLELKRIDIRGEDSLDDFRIKLRKGKLRPF